MRAILALLLFALGAGLPGCRSASRPSDPSGPPPRVGGTPPAAQLPPGIP